MGLASALITCTVTSPGQPFLAPTPRQQKAKTAGTFEIRGEYFLQCHVFAHDWSSGRSLVVNFGHEVASLAVVRDLDPIWCQLHCHIAKEVVLGLAVGIIQPAREARGLRALGLLLADGALTVGWGKTFWGIGRVPSRKRA